MTLVLVSLLMVVLMVFAAFAIDLGAAYNERRQSQSAADAGALAAARRIANGEGRATAVQEALNISRGDANFPQSASDWATDFLSDCPETPPSGYTATAATPCVSFSFNNQRVRVHLPDMEVRTTFARVIGINQLHTSAFAEAGMRIEASSDLLPYGLPGASASGNEVCIKVPSTLDHATLETDTVLAYQYSGCSGSSSDPAQGNFRRLDAAIYGNFDTGTSSISNVPYCPPGGGGLNADTVISINTAFGIDHILTTHPSPNSGAPSLPSDIDDWTKCPDIGAGANLVHTQTGTTANGLTNGMSASNVASSGQPGRLVRSTSYSTAVVRTSNPRWEVAPLWNFIDPAETNLPGTCKRATFSDSASDATLFGLGVPNPIPWRSATLTRAAPYPASPGVDSDRGNESRAHMLKCLTDYKAGSGYATLFGLDSDGDPNNRQFDIQATNRFGFVPILGGEASSNNFRIAGYAPIYLDTAYFRCNSQGCLAYHSPGSSTLERLNIPVASNIDMDAMSAYFLGSTGILPPPIIEDSPGQRTNLKLELVK